jgi:hypothetical protein
MGGGGTSEQKSQPPITQFLNPAGAVVAGLFDVPVAVGEGGFQLGETAYSRTPSGKFVQTPGGISLGDIVQGGFGPEAFGNIPELLNLAPFTAGAVPALGGLGIQSAIQGSQTLQDLLGPTADLAATGAPVNVDALVQRAVSDVAEQFAPITGLFSTDLLNQATRTASELRVGAEEAAANRRLQAIPLASLLATTGSELPVGAALDLLGLGEAFTETATPAGRQATLLERLAGLQPTSAVPRGNVSAGESKTTQVL